MGWRSGFPGSGLWRSGFPGSGLWRSGFPGSRFWVLWILALWIPWIWIVALSWIPWISILGALDSCALDSLYLDSGCFGFPGSRFWVLWILALWIPCIWILALWISWIWIVALWIPCPC